MKVAFDTRRTHVGYAHDTIRVSRFASLERVATYFEWSFGNICPIFASYNPKCAQFCPVLLKYRGVF